MRAEFEEPWTEREEARAAVRGALAGGSTFCALLNACKNLRGVIQVTKARDMKG